MKELSIEEKARAYDEVREKIAIRFGSNVADEIFSQFEESEDEKVRKAIIELVRQSSEVLDKQNQNNMIAWLEKQGEQKPEWSDEDEEMRAAVLQLITDSEKENGWNCVYCDDKEIYFSDIIAWLKSLKYRYTWKPSDEQMNALDDVISSRDIKYDILSELWKDLKKL